MQVSKSDWKDGDSCSRCEKPFKMTRRKHHCRFCGRIFCDKCSSSREEGKRACLDCSERRSNGGSRPVTPEPFDSISSSGMMTGGDPSPRERISSLNSIPESSVKSIDISKVFSSVTGKKNTSDLPNSIKPPSLEVQALQAKVHELENQLKVLQPENLRLKSIYTELKSRTHALEEQKIKQDALKRMRNNLLRENRETADLEISERKADFDKSEHHQKDCELCGVEYTLTRREHHCRLCFKSICNSCSRNRLSKKQRACSHCYARHILQSRMFTQYLSENRIETLSWIALFERLSNSMWETVPS
eukprot:TRINITY_DN2520_c2_g1_i1.p1 TRINITY_DN2520_c2_g1~~TRINITY_DN2520_c2_g1_i1.p1  ORF type:complete len:304 (+),score=33.39 TRINITY_DN2520_c2_g1_i1:112-1023(+)